ncbi:MAG: hypothetical protein FWC16_11110 [Defluviitaleaceae bacterium]|nr:hypothetical protein [Defluviitaleaceae bacterium]MCL2275466.1 hypothetical protein [Defluviitaleaceae bacterium]
MIKTDVYMITLAKQTLPHRFNNIDEVQSKWFTVLGFYDHLKIETLRKFDNILDVDWTSKNSNGLTRKISLIDFAPSRYDLPSFISEAITYICMIKLDARLFASKNTSSAYAELENVKNAILQSFKAYKKYQPENAENLELKVLYSLSVYDVIICIKHPAPSAMASAYLYIKHAVASLSFSTSFFIIDFSNYEKYMEIYNSIHAENMHIKFKLKHPIKLDILKCKAIKTLNLINAKEITIGYTPGDTDVVLIAKQVPLLDILCAFNNMQKNSDIVIDVAVKHMQSSFSFFNFEEDNRDSGHSDLLSLQRFSDGLREFEAVVGQYEDMKKENSIPYSCFNVLENFFLTFDYLFTYREHHDAIFRFLRVLKKGLDSHKKLSSELKNARMPAIIEFVSDLHLSLRNFASAGTVYMDRMLELHPMNPYAKILFSYGHLAKTIFSVLPHCGERVKELEVIITVSKKMELNSTQHFKVSDEKNVFVTLDAPHIQFLSLRQSFLYLLHEMAHYCYGGERRKKLLKYAALFYISREVAMDKYGECTVNMKIKRKLRKTLLELRSLVNEIYSKKGQDLDVEDALYYLIGLHRDDNGLSITPSNVSNEVFVVLKDLAMDNDFSFVDDVDYSLSEATADVLMLELSSNDDSRKKLIKYIRYVNRYFNQNDINPFKDKRRKVFSFVRRCYFVFMFYGYEFKFLLESTFESILNNTITDEHEKKQIVSILGELNKRYAAFAMYEDLANEFTIFLKDLINSRNLCNDLLNALCLSQTDGKVNYTLDNLDAECEVNLHMNNWYLSLCSDT